MSTDTLREIAGHGCVHLNKPVRAKELTRHIQRLLAKPQSAAPAGAPQLLECEGASTVSPRTAEEPRTHPAGTR